MIKLVPVSIIMVTLCFAQQKRPISFTPLTDEILKNATYYDMNYGSVKLTNGEFYINKSADMFGDLRFLARGDLDGDGNEDAAVVLYSYTGGNDPDATLCAVLNRSGKPNVISCIPLNMYVDSIKIVKGVIILRVGVYVKGDTGHWPSGTGIVRYKLVGNTLKQKK